MPGFIETRTHLDPTFGEVLGRIWLAYGITSVRDISLNPYVGLEQREAIANGRRLGPRIFIAGDPFDREILRLMAAGDARGMARFFDDYTVPPGDRSQDAGTRGRDATGMPSPGGPQGGTRETCNWIAAAAVADGKPATIVDYVPVYASPIGAGFAYWPEV